MAGILRDLPRVWNQLPLYGRGGHVEGDAPAAHEGDAHDFRGEGVLALLQEEPIAREKIF